jgi:SAM-dependent methyltransferase
MIDPSEDAFGAALVDYLEGSDVPELVLETDDGEAGPAMHPEWFFRSFDRWEWWDRKLLPLVEHGPVLDLGAGAGRASLYLHERGLPVTAVDASPGAVEVCRRRGVGDVRLGDVNDPPADQPWAGVLLLCGNLGLGGSWEGNRRLLSRLAELAAPGAVLVGDSVTQTAQPVSCCESATGTWSLPGGRSTTSRPSGWRRWWAVLAGGWRCTWKTARITRSCCAAPSSWPQLCLSCCCPPPGGCMAGPGSAG